MATARDYIAIAELMSQLNEKCFGASGRMHHSGRRMMIGVFAIAELRCLAWLIAGREPPGEKGDVWRYFRNLSRELHADPSDAEMVESVRRVAAMVAKHRRRE